MLPKYDEIMWPLLTLFQQAPEHTLTTKQTYQKVAEYFGLSEAEQEERLKTGQPVYVNRVGWAMTYLKKAGLLNAKGRGVAELTQAGVHFLQQHQSNEPIVDLLIHIPMFKAFKEAAQPQKNPVAQEAIKAEILSPSALTPLEMIEAQKNILDQDIRTELLSLLKSVEPSFFERLVVDLLVGMGYGGSHQDAAQAIGKSGDGGIDGIISEDRLGLDKIYLQAKRWEGVVGRPEIHKFKGALTDQGATKGVFITISGFTAEARESAKKSGIILIDGNRLTDLMIEFGVGVSVARSYQIHKIDADYFEGA